MTNANSLTRARLTNQPRAHNEMGWLLAVAAAFLLVHIVALAISQRAFAGQATAGPSAISELCD